MAPKWVSRRSCGGLTISFILGDILKYQNSSWSPPSVGLVSIKVNCGFVSFHYGSAQITNMDFCFSADAFSGEMKTF